MATTPMDRELGRLLSEGQAAAKRGDKAMARALLTQLVEKEPRHEEAWMWLSGVVADPFEQQICLENALVINPANAQARKGLAYLAARTGAPTHVPHVPDAPDMAASTNGAPPVPQPTEQDVQASANGAIADGSSFGNSAPFGDMALPTDGPPPWAMGDPEFDPNSPPAQQQPPVEQIAPESPYGQAPAHTAAIELPAPTPEPDPMGMSAADLGLPADAQPFVVPGTDAGAPGAGSGTDDDIPDWLGNLTPSVQITEEPQYSQGYAPFNHADFAVPQPTSAPPTSMMSELPDGMSGATTHFAGDGQPHTDPSLGAQGASQGQFYDAGGSDLGPMGPYGELQLPTPDQLPGGGSSGSHQTEGFGAASSEQPWYLRTSSGNMPPVPDHDGVTSSKLSQTLVDESAAKRAGAMVVCPNCRESVPDTSLACPSCRYSFFVNCPFCHELVDTSDAKPGVSEACPYCQNEISKMDMGLGTVNESASQKVPGSRPGMPHSDPKHAYPSMNQQLVEGPVVERRPAIAWVVDFMWLVAIIVMVWALTQLPTWLNLPGQY